VVNILRFRNFVRKSLENLSEYYTKVNSIQSENRRKLNLISSDNRWKINLIPSEIRRKLNLIPSEIHRKLYLILSECVRNLFQCPTNLNFTVCVKIMRNPSKTFFRRNLGQNYDLRRDLFGQRPIRPNSVVIVSKFRPKTVRNFVQKWPIFSNDNCILDAIGMTSESPSGYYEFLNVYCTTTPSVSLSSILQIYGSSNSLMH
jgi:hypothetical protein